MKSSKFFIKLYTVVDVRKKIDNYMDCVKDMLSIVLKGKFRRSKNNFRCSRLTTITFSGFK